MIKLIKDLIEVDARDEPTAEGGGSPCDSQTSSEIDSKSEELNRWLAQKVAAINSGEPFICPHASDIAGEIQEDVIIQFEECCETNHTLLDQLACVFSKFNQAKITFEQRFNNECEAPICEDRAKGRIDLSIWKIQDFNEYLTKSIEAFSPVSYCPIVIDASRKKVEEAPARLQECCSLDEGAQDDCVITEYESIMIEIKNLVNLSCSVSDTFLDECSDAFNRLVDLGKDVDDATDYLEQSSGSRTSKEYIDLKNECQYYKGVLHNIDEDIKNNIEAPFSNRILCALSGSFLLEKFRDVGHRIDNFCDNVPYPS